MFNNILTNSPAVWTTLIATLALLPPLIHLINVMRHKRVKWAAMDFLLKSHKKNRNRVRLKQFLLLATRMAALLIALFLLGQVGCQNDQISTFLTGGTTHHYVLLDDSLSMQDETDNESIFDRAIATIYQIANRADGRQKQRFTLIRFSKAQFTNPYPRSELESSTNTILDLNRQLVDSDFSSRLESTVANFSPTELAVDGQQAIDFTQQLIKTRPNENSILYVLSDFRRNDWDDNAELKQSIQNAEENGAAIELISCVDQRSENLAITEFTADGNVRAAGVPLMMKISIENFSNVPINNVQIKIRTKEYQQARQDTRPEDLSFREDETPTVFIEKIDAGKVETRLFPVYFHSSGQHVITAQLPSDSILTDNVRHAVVEFANSAKVLLIDQSEPVHAKFLALAMNPGQMTGIEPQIHTKAFLRDTTPNELNQYDVVFLLDIDQLDETAVAHLEAFVQQGGGLCVFLGPRSNLNFYNQRLFNDGTGLLPMPLARILEIPENQSNPSPDIVPRNHPVFDPVINVKTSLLDFVQVDQIVQPPLDWVEKTQTKNQADNGQVASRVLANIRGDVNLPLMIEGRFGIGKTMLVTTTAGPQWNNWVRNGTFPPTLLLIENYLASGRYTQVPRTTGSEWTIPLSAQAYLPEVSWVVSRSQQPRTVSTELLDAANDHTIVATFGMQNQDLMFTTAKTGIYESWLQSTKQEFEVRRIAINPDARESQTELLTSSTLSDFLEGLNATFVTWRNFNPEPEQTSSTSLTKLLFLLLVGTLVIEQLLAYSAGYHPISRRQSARAT